MKKPLTLKREVRTIGHAEVWNRPERLLGYLDGLSGIGGLVAPLLAGFSLTAIALLLTSSKEPHLWSWALVAFAGAVAFLLHSMQLASFAIARDPRPATHLDWFPEALIDEGAARDVRDRQAKTYEASVKFWHRSMVTYDVGLTAFTAGVVLLLIPYPDHWTGQRIAAIVFAGGAFVLEAWWVTANRLTRQKLSIFGRSVSIFEHEVRLPRLPHPVVRKRDPKIVVRELESRLLWAIVDPERFNAAAEEADGSEPTTVSESPGRP